MELCLLQLSNSQYCWWVRQQNVWSK
jgi:hypothetical protein